MKIIINLDNGETYTIVGQNDVCSVIAQFKDDGAVKNTFILISDNVFINPIHISSILVQ